MTSWYRWSFALVTFIVTASGVAYFVMKYFLESVDPFSVVNHPLQPLMLHVHVLSSPWLLLLFGALLQGHVAAKLKQSGTPNRWSGLISIGSFAVMAITGYLLQVTVSTSLARAFMAAHVASGTIFVVSYGAHVVVSLLLARRQARVEAPAAFSPDPNAAGQF